MPCSPGDRVGPYEILAPLGAGGMGEVYRARDSRLGRAVAIKVLRSGDLQSPERRRRFEIEARAASSLNHPNILTVHDIGEVNCEPYIVSELLEGETLRAVMARRRLSVREILDIAVQITDGLAAAHGAGITHRDLKPDNLFVLPDGRVKILDFGLAKTALAKSPDEETETLSELITGDGVIVGTIAYMSPEQAKGQALDFRSDQFSLGVILYEMAAGKRPFQREDPISTLAAVVKEDPVPLATIDAQLPAPLRWMVERCLAKEPGRRYASSSDLHRQLRDLRDHLSELSTSVQPLSAPPQQRKRPVGLVLAAAGVAVGVLLTLLVWPESPQAPYRYTPFATEAGDESEPEWSADGQSLTYIAAVNGVGQVFTRRVNSPVPAQITHSQTACAAPFWSPDGTRIYYRTQNSLWSVGAVGGAPQPVLPGIAGPTIGVRNHSATISPDGKTLAFFRLNGPSYSLYLMPVAGTDPVQIQTRPFPATFRFSDDVRFSPDGKKLLAAVLPAIGPDAGAEVWIIPFPDGTPRKLQLQARLNSGFRVPSISWASDSRHCVFSMEPTPGSGSHVYLADTETGAVQPVTAGTGEESEPVVSPDGRRIAFASGGFQYDLTTMSLDGSKISPLLATARQEYSASWSPSGQQYAYVSNAAGGPGIWLRSVSENSARPIVELSQGSLFGGEPRFSPDGQRLAYLRMGERHAVWISNLSGGAGVPLEQESTDQHHGAWSPDGNWIVYTRFAGQKWEIAKAPSGGGGRPVRLCDGGDSVGWVEWSPAGEWIAFLDPKGVHLVAPEGGVPRLLHGPAAAFAFSKDGSTIYLLRRAADRHFELASLGVPDGKEKQSVRVNLSSETAVRDMSLHPDGDRFAVSVGVQKRDIWIMDGFELPGGWMRRLWPR